MYNTDIIQNGIITSECRKKLQESNVVLFLPLMRFVLFYILL